jgi:hypothetical protein
VNRVDDEIHVRGRYLVEPALIDFFFNHLYGFVHGDVVEWNPKHCDRPAIPVTHPYTLHPFLVKPSLAFLGSSAQGFAIVSPIEELAVSTHLFGCRFRALGNLCLQHPAYTSIVPQPLSAADYFAKLGVSWELNN